MVIERRCARCYYYFKKFTINERTGLIYFSGGKNCLKQANEASLDHSKTYVSHKVQHVGLMDNSAYTV